MLGLTTLEVNLLFHSFCCDRVNIRSTNIHEAFVSTKIVEYSGNFVVDIVFFYDKR